MSLLLLGATAPPSLVAVPPPAVGVATVSRPNVLFILIDDMGIGDLSIMGNRKVATPNLDQLARSGALLTQFYDAAPICSSSRAGFLTGRFPATVGFVGITASRAANARLGQADWLDPATPTIARMLHDAGYATGHFGKWHLGGGRDIGDAPLITRYGFDESLTTFEGLGPRVLVSDEERDLADQSARLGHGPVFYRPKAVLTQLFCDRTLDFIARHRDRPWFAQLWLNDVHDPWAPDEATLQTMKGKGGNADDDRYLATLVAMDRSLGALLRNLADMGELQNTLIVLTSDNGPSSLARYDRDGGTAPGSTLALRGRKFSLYEGGIRQPLIVSWPGHVKSNVRDDRTVGQGVDLMPTIASFAGTVLPPGSDGIDLSPAFAGKPVARRPALFWAYAKEGASERPRDPAHGHDVAPRFAVRDGRWKLLANPRGRDVELYDIDADPQEAHDVAVTRPVERERLQGMLDRWMAGLRAQTPAPH